MGHRRKLPYKVRGIAQAGTQALPGKRRGLVRGVASQQHPALAPLFGDAGAEGIDRLLFGTNTETPCCANSSASVTPVGPPPATRISQS